MALVLNDRVKETSTTTGTGDVTFAGAVSGFDTFDPALPGHWAHRQQWVEVWAEEVNAAIRGAVAAGADLVPLGNALALAVGRDRSTGSGWLCWCYSTCSCKHRSY